MHSIMYFLGQNYTKCVEVLRSLKPKNVTLEAVVNFEKIMFHLFLKDYMIINEIQRSKSKFIENKLFYYRFCLLEHVYHIELCKDGKFTSKNPSIEEIDLYLLENGYKEDQDLLSRVKLQ
jgi:hypothetical protein